MRGGESKLSSVTAGCLRTAKGRSLGDRLVGVALVAYGVVVWLLRPLTPFEQDEVLFLKALDRYDVALHSPHPPGYPLFVGVGKAVRWLIGDPVAALQLVAVVASVAAVGGVWLLARRLGAGRAAAATAAAMLATVPTFVFHANVGLSDIPGTACTVLAVIALVAALDAPRTLPLAAAASAAAVAVRPQLILALAVLGVVAIVAAARRRRWGALALALAVGLAVSVACWLPAILVTGAGRFRQAVADAGVWAAYHEAGTRLPGIPLTTVARYWLVAPFGTHVLAALFWLAVIAGAVAWWRSGRRRLVGIALACGGSYLVAAPFAMGAGEAVRYILPALPFLALLAAGLLMLVPAAQRWGAATLAAVWCLAAVVWIGPLVVLRARAPAPAWACLEWISAHENAAVTTVVYDGVFRPHVGYVLSPRGFHVEEMYPGVAYASEEPGGSVVFVTRAPRSPGEVLLERSWDVAALRPLSRHYYDRCVVTRQPAADSAKFSAGFRVGAGEWELTGNGTVALPDGAPPQLVRVRAGGTPLAVAAAGSVPVALPPGGEAFVPLEPGVLGVLRIEVPGGATARVPELELFPVGNGDAAWLTRNAGEHELLVPSAAHAPGRMRSDWVTDLLLHNPDSRLPIEIALRWSQRLDLGGAVLPATRIVPPGATVLVRDVVATVFHAGGAGALRLVAERPFTALWRTYDENAPRTLADPAFAPPVTGAQAITRGTLTLSYRPGPAGVRSNAAFFNASGEPAEVRLDLVKAGSDAAPGVWTLRLPPWGFGFLDGERLIGTNVLTVAADFTLRFAATRPVVAFVSVVENASNRSRYVFAGQQAAPSKAP